MAPKNALDRTILYITDSKLDPWLSWKCRELLLKVSDGVPIISVSQQPLDFGENICVGDIGQSGVSIDTQLVAGLERVKTKWLLVAEHDCVYSREHILWTPPDENVFWYNDNVWLLQLWNPLHPDWDGMFSHTKRRRVQSQLICDTDRFREILFARLKLMEDVVWKHKDPGRWIREPGCYNEMRCLRKFRELRRHPLRLLLKRHLTRYAAKDFKTKTPNVDIRHGHNLTGQRRGKKRRFALEPWGSMNDMLDASPEFILERFNE